MEGEVSHTIKLASIKKESSREARNLADIAFIPAQPNKFTYQTCLSQPVRYFPITAGWRPFRTSTLTCTVGLALA